MRGKRAYGRVDAYGGEYAETLFEHAYYMPLVPRGSFWITHDDGKSRTGFPTARSARSVAAAYLRWWGPVVAVLALAAPLTVGGPLAVVTSALVAWAWTWRGVHGALARQRSDWNLCALGSRCEPALLVPEERARLQARLTSHWRTHAFERTPEQVARHGPTSAAEALLAYGLLRLGRADALADRLVLGRHEPGSVLRIVDVAADVADAAREWHRCAPDEDEDHGRRDWADRLASDGAFAAAIAQARRAEGKAARARAEQAAALAHAGELRSASGLLALGAGAFAAVAWAVEPADRVRLLAAAGLAAAGAIAVLATAVRGRRRAEAALAALVATEEESTS